MNFSLSNLVNNIKNNLIKIHNKVISFFEDNKKHSNILNSYLLFILGIVSVVLIDRHGFALFYFPFDLFYEFGLFDFYLHLFFEFLKIFLGFVIYYFIIVKYFMLQEIKFNELVHLKGLFLLMAFCIFYITSATMVLSSRVFDIYFSDRISVIMFFVICYLLTTALNTFHKGGIIKTIFIITLFLIAILKFYQKI